MHLISLSASDHQKSRLRNGHKVRVKHGAGFNLIVSPNTYHLVSRAFNKNKGISMQLSPEEIEMNRAPTPEMQSQIMGHNEHLILPNTTGHLIKGTGAKEFFQNIGNKLKGAYEKVRDTIRTPIENAIVNPIKNAYEQNVPESIRRDISTGAKIMSPAYLFQDMIKKVKEGKNPVEMYNQYKDDLLHLNKTKNKIIQSSPVLTELYKKGVMTTAGLGSAALGTTLGLNPATGALAGAAGSMAARELLKAEGYGLHHAIEHGEKHHYHELKHHCKPIGGALKMSHVTNFFKNAGNKVKQAFQQATPYVKKGAQEVHNFILNNPELAKKIKEHGSKLAGMFAKAGVNYLSGDEKYGEEAEKYGSKFGDEQIHKNLGYGLHHAIEHGEKHHYDELKHHCRPIGGRITLKHVKDFFVNAGRKIAPAIKHGAKEVHNFILDNPELAKKIKEHGAKLAGMFAKAGANYLSGDEKYGEEAEKYGSKFGDEQIHKNLGYGIGDDIGNSFLKMTNYMLKGKGIHRAIEHGEKHHYDELKHHSSPIGGALKMSHVTNFFKNAGNKIKQAFQQATPYVKKGAQEVHNFILNNPELAKKIKEHGSKLAGIFAKAGANYLSGDEKYGEEAEKYGSKFGDEQIHKNLGYGLYGGVSGSGSYGGGAYGCGLGTGLYAGKMRGTGPFQSFHTLQNASDGYANAMAELAGMSKHIIHNQHTQRPIAKYYDGDNAPPSRGTGIHPHNAHHIHQNDHLHHRDNTRNSHDTNLIRGRGTLIEHDAHLPPALVSQPYGANFHMQFQLPPQYQKYNDGTYTY